MPSAQPAEAGYAHLLAEVARNETIRRAECLVSASWAIELLDAQMRSDADLRTRQARRDLISERLREARSQGDLRAIASAQRELEAADVAVAQATVADHDLRTTAIGQVEELADAARVRLEEAITDEIRLTAARKALAGGNTDSE